MFQLALPNAPAPQRNWNAIERNHGRAARLELEQEQRNWNAEMNAIAQRNINDPGWRNRGRAEQANARRLWLQQQREQQEELDRVWGPLGQAQAAEEGPNLDASMAPTGPLRYILKM